MRFKVTTVRNLNGMPLALGGLNCLRTGGDACHTAGADKRVLFSCSKESIE